MLLEATAWRDAADVDGDVRLSRHINEKRRRLSSNSDNGRRQV